MSTPSNRPSQARPYRPLARLLAVVAIALVASMLAGPASAAPADRAKATVAIAKPPAPPPIERFHKKFHPRPSDPKRMREAWRLYKSQHARNYQLTVGLGCFCMMHKPMVTTVRHGRIVFVARVNHPDHNIARRGWTVNRVFLMMRKANRQADKVAVKYTSAGVPRSIFVDYYKHAVDDELYWHVKLDVS